MYIMYMRVGNGLNIKFLDSLIFHLFPYPICARVFCLQEMKKDFSLTSIILQNMMKMYYLVFHPYSIQIQIACQGTEGLNFYNGMKFIRI